MSEFDIFNPVEKSVILVVPSIQKSENVFDLTSPLTQPTIEVNPKIISKLNRILTILAWVQRRCRCHCWKLKWRCFDAEYWFWSWRRYKCEFFLVRPGKNSFLGADGFAEWEIRKQFYLEFGFKRIILRWVICWTTNITGCWDNCQGINKAKKSRVSSFLYHYCNFYRPDVVHFAFYLLWNGLHGTRRQYCL